MLFTLKASGWTKQNSSRFSIGFLQETSRLSNHSLALPTSTANSSRIIQRRSVHLPVSSRKIPVSPSIRKLSLLFRIPYHVGTKFIPERGEDFISKNPMKFQQLIKQDEVLPSRYFAVKVESFLNLIDSIQKALWQYSQYRSIPQELGK
ncbi:hypothetical protein O181_110334, partial [Austropuccinia psidii MF-1]|nr:hypothetical protein [Austropuccinia psidii MF-1]